MKNSTEYAERSSVVKSNQRPFHPFVSLRALRPLGPDLFLTYQLSVKILPP